MGDPNADYDDELGTLMLMMLPLSSTRNAPPLSPPLAIVKPGALGKQIWQAARAEQAVSTSERENRCAKKEDSAVARTARALKIKSGALALLLSLSLWLSLSLCLSLGCAIKYAHSH